MTGSAARTRIALVTPSLPPLATDGISASHYNLYLQLKDRYQVRVFTYNDCSPAPPGEEGVVRSGLSWFGTRMVGGLTRLLLRGMGAKGTLYQFRDALCGALAGLKLLAPLRSFAPDIIIVPDQGPTSAFWPRLRHSKVIFVSHHNSMRFHNQPFLGEHSERDARLGRHLEQRAVSKADLVLCPSRYMKETFAATYSFAGPVEVMPNLADPDGMSAVPAAPLQGKLGLPASAPVLYIPSAASIYKGSRFVPDIVCGISDRYQGEIGFYLSGSVDQKGLAALRGALPGRVRILAPGTVPNSENISYVKGCSHCVSPTLVENFSMALLEAQWLGLPVITFDIGGNRDIISDGATGFLVPFPDASGLVARALELLASPERSAALGRAAQASMQERFAPSLILARYEEVFQRLKESGCDPQNCGVSA